MDPNLDFGYHNRRNHRGDLLIFKNARTGESSPKLRIPAGGNPSDAKRVHELAGWEFPPSAEADEVAGFWIVPNGAEKVKKEGEVESDD